MSELMFISPPDSLLPVDESALHSAATALKCLGGVFQFFGRFLFRNLSLGALLFISFFSARV